MTLETAAAGETTGREEAGDGGRLPLAKCFNCRWLCQPPGGRAEPSLRRSGLLTVLARVVVSPFRWIAGRFAPSRAEERSLHSLPLQHADPAGIAVRDPPVRDSLDPVRQSALERSIARFGIIEPLVVQHDGKGLRLVAGHRRLLAARRLGLASVPVVVLDVPEAREFRYLEGLSAEPLGAWEEARAIERVWLCDRTLVRERLPDSLGLPSSWVAERLELLALPSVLQEALRERVIGPSEARLLRKLSGPDEMLGWIRRLRRGDATIPDLMEYLRGPSAATVGGERFTEDGDGRPA